MPVLNAILRDRYTWKYHTVAVGISLSILLFALIPGVSTTMVLPTVAAFLIVGIVLFWTSPNTYRHRGEPDDVRPDRHEPNHVGTVQILDPRMEIATTASALFEQRIARGTARRNAMGIPVVSSPTKRIATAVSAREREARRLCAPTKADPYIDRHTPQWHEVKRILGPRARLIRSGSVRQINGRWLKADQFVIDEFGWPVRDGADGLKIQSVRIRIPRDSWLRKDFKHPKR
ncbi:hypothetical protein ACIGKR_29905 [Rhodococcus qingshengii]|uniref:hypothetical protein n=1 Tax=Rhodococcus qingshengii TaxID=334542 RepID=UPI0037CC7729